MASIDPQGSEGSLSRLGVTGALAPGRPLGEGAGALGALRLTSTDTRVTERRWGWLSARPRVGSAQQGAEDGLVTAGPGEGPGSPQGPRDTAVGASSPLAGRQVPCSAFPDAPSRGPGCFMLAWRRSRPRSPPGLVWRGHWWGRGLPLAGVTRLLSKNCLDSLLLYWRVGWGEGTRAGAGCCLHMLALGSSAHPSPCVAHVRDNARQPRVMACAPLASWSLGACQGLLVRVLYETPRVLVVYCANLPRFGSHSVRIARGLGHDCVNHPGVGSCLCELPRVRDASV